MLTTTLIVLAGAAMSAAQTTASPTGPVVSLYLPDTDPQNLVASLVGSSGPMTTYVVGCPEGTDPSDCGYSGGITITEGAGSLLFSQTMPDFTASADCTWTGTTAGICVESYGGSAANFPGLSTTTLAASDITFLPVTVTAGVTGALATASAGAATSSSGNKGGATSERARSWICFGGLAFAFAFGSWF